MNKIMLIGNLGKDPDMVYTDGGTAITKFTLAVNRVTKTSSGERKEETDWFNIVAFRDLAERCNTYLTKGQKVFIEGRLQQRKYTDRDNVTRYMVEVIMNDMEFLTPKDKKSSSDSILEEDPLGDLNEHPF